MGRPTWFGRRWICPGKTTGYLRTGKRPPTDAALTGTDTRGRGSDPHREAGIGGGDQHQRLRVVWFRFATAGAGTGGHEHQTVRCMFRRLEHFRRTTARETPVRTAGRASNPQSALRASHSVRRRSGAVQTARRSFCVRSAANGRSTRRRVRSHARGDSYLGPFAPTPRPNNSNASSRGYALGNRDRALATVGRRLARQGCRVVNGAG